MAEVKAAAALGLALALAGCHHGPPGPAVSGARDLGALGDPAAPKLLRDGGASIALGGQILWTFGDTLFPFQSVDGAQLRTNTAALASPSAPLSVAEPLDANGAPYPFVPFTADEAAYNAASGRPDERIALWPGAMVALPDGTALVIVDRLKIHPGNLNYEELSTELAIASPGSTSATRAGALFAAPEPAFVHGAVLGGGFLHLYSCIPRNDCLIARAPLTAASDRAAYQFFEGNGWTKDLSRAARVVPGSTAGHSIFWNDALGAYLSASTPGFSNELWLRTAPAPEGPWSEPTVAWRAPSAIYATYLHPELSSARTVVVSYSRATGDFAGEIRLVAIDLD